jgi:hypothetical protein
VLYLCLVELWSVYHQPAAASCAVRKVVVEQDGLRCTGEQLFGSVWEARSALVRRGLVRVPRAAGDEPSLVETWL